MFTLGKMGKHCQICDGVIITDPEFTFLGNNVILNERVILLTFDSSATIRIGNNVTFSFGVTLLTGGLNIADGSYSSHEHITAAINIEDNVWIGANAVILAGVTIGKGAVIGAGSIVTKDVEPNTLVAGVPAKFIRRLDSHEKGKG